MRISHAALVGILVIQFTLLYFYLGPTNTIEVKCSTPQRNETKIEPPVTEEKVTTTKPTEKEEDKIISHSTSEEVHISQPFQGFSFM